MSNSCVCKSSSFAKSLFHFNFWHKTSSVVFDLPRSVSRPDDPQVDRDVSPGRLVRLQVRQVRWQRPRHRLLLRFLHSGEFDFTLRATTMEWWTKHRATPKLLSNNARVKWLIAKWQSNFKKVSESLRLYNLRRLALRLWIKYRTTFELPCSITG